MTDAAINYTTKETAVFIRLALKAAFPAQKFSVRTDYYSMGSSVDVRWTDGPTEPEVKRITDAFTSKTFDGSDDSTHYHTQIVNGQRVNYSGSICVHRETSDALQAMAYRRVCQSLGIEPRTDVQFWNDYRDGGGNGLDTIGTLTSRFLHTLRPNGCRVMLKDEAR